MNQPNKFLFDTDFDESPPGPEPVPMAPEPSDVADNPGKPESQSEPAPSPQITEADLAAARKEGYEEGRMAGHAEAADEREQAIADALGRLPSALEGLDETHTSLLDRLRDECLQVAVSLVRKFLPALTQRHGLAEIEAVIADCLKRIPREPRVVVRLPDAHFDPIKEKIDSLANAAAFDGKVVLIADDQLEPGDVRVEWADGGSERDTTRFWRDVDAALGRMASQPARTQNPRGAPTAPAASVPPASTTPSEPADAAPREQHSSASPPLQSGEDTLQTRRIPERQAIGAR